MDRATYGMFFLLNSKLNRILAILGDEIMPELDALTEAVARVETATDAVLAKIEQLKTTSNVDPAALQALADRLTAVSDRLGAGAA